MSRMLVIEPHLTSSAGHYLELALTVLHGGIERGFEPCLFTAKAFNEIITDERVQVERVFSHPKARKWSQTPAWYSRVSRDLNGRPVGGNSLSRIKQRVVDRLHGPNPMRVVKQSRDELSAALARFAPNCEDAILFATTDDYLFLIYASAIASLRLEFRLNIAFLWHVPYQNGRGTERVEGYRELPELRAQVDRCVELLDGHSVQLLATTQELERQLNASVGRSLWSRIDYPIRSEFTPKDCISPERPYRMLMGGTQRAEKGKKSLPTTAALLSRKHLGEGKWQLGLQSTIDKAVKLFPQLRNREGDEVLGPFCFRDIVLANPGMGADEYVAWIKSADVGLFLYDARTYYTRCSGVLVEMLACGIPVVVPACSWLSRQIAPSMQGHLARFAETLRHRHSNVMRFDKAGQFGELYCRGGDLSREAISVTQGSDEGILFEFDISGVTCESYLSIEVDEDRGYGIESTRAKHTLELPMNDLCRMFIRATGSRRALKIHLSNPFVAPKLHLISVRAMIATGELASMPSSSVGLIYETPVDLQQCFDELDDCLPDYQESANIHANVWRKKHSPAAFVTEILKPLI